MAEITKNVFTNGMVLDLSPSATSLTFLTDALNATLVTNNGNELSLLNDMGNARVNNVTLPPGYSPVGTCEYGSIIYVLSVNPENGRSQIGSFPSPEYILDSDKDANVSVDYSDFFEEIDLEYRSAYKNSEKITEKVKRTTEVTVTKKPTNKRTLNPGDSYKIVRNDGYASGVFELGTIQPVLLKSDGTQLDLQKLEKDVWQFNSNKSSGELALRFDLNTLTSYNVKYTADRIEESKLTDSEIFNVTFTFDKEDPYSMYVGTLVEVYEGTSKTDCYFTEGDKLEIKGPKSGIISYKFTPWLIWETETNKDGSEKILCQGLYEQGSKIITIDYSKIGTDVAELSEFKYFAMTDDIYLNMTLNLYPSLSREISKITLDFFDNQGGVARYTIDDMDGSYSGSYELTLPLNGSSTIAQLESKSFKFESEKNTYSENFTTPYKTGTTLNKDNTTTDVMSKGVSYHHGVILYLNNEKDHTSDVDLFPADSITYNVLVVTKNDITYSLNVSRSLDGWTFPEYLDSDKDNPFINNVKLITQNNVGILQSNYLYSCIINVWTNKESEESEKPKIWQTFREWFWTNGVYNNEFYDSSVSNVNDCDINLYIDGTLNITPKSSNSEEEGPIVYNSEENIYKYTKTSNYNIEVSFNELGLLSDYNTFELVKNANVGIPDVDHQTQTYAIYQGGDPIIDFEQPGVTSNSTSDFYDTLPDASVTFSSNTLLGTSSDIVTYVTTDGEVATTNKLLKSNIILSGTYTSYLKQKESSSGQTITVMDPIASSPEDLYNIYGINYPVRSSSTGSDSSKYSVSDEAKDENYFVQTYSMWLHADGDDRGYNYFCPSFAFGINGFKHNKVLEFDNGQGQENFSLRRLASLIPDPDYPNETNNLSNVVYYDRNNNRSFDNLRARITLPFVLFNITSSCNYAIAVRTVNTGELGSNSSPQSPYYLIHQDLSDGAPQGIYQYGSILGIKDSASNIHLTNTFTTLLDKDDYSGKNLSKEVGSMLMLIYKKTKTSSANKVVDVYHENSTAYVTYNIVLVVKSFHPTRYIKDANGNIVEAENLGPYIKILGLDYADDQAIHNVLSKHFTLSDLNIKLVLNTKLIPVTLEIQSYEHKESEESNIQLNTVYGTIKTYGNVENSKLYGYYNGEFYELSNEFIGYHLNLIRTVDNDKNTTYSFEINEDVDPIISPNFGEIFKLQNKKLVLSQYELNESTYKDDYWALVLRWDSDQGRLMPWLSNPKNEVVIQNRDYESMAKKEKWDDSENFYTAGSYKEYESDSNCVIRN